MKFRTSLFLIFAFAAMASMTSCRKEYLCSCHFKYTNYPGLPDSFAKDYTIYDSKKGAEAKCKAESGTFKNNNINTDEACKLY